MRVYKTESSKDKLFFANYKRIDEEIVFSEIKDILNNTPTITIGDKMIGPSEDIFKCSISGKAFELVFDIDYGGYIYSNSQKTLKSLEDILNK